MGSSIDFLGVCAERFRDSYAVQKYEILNTPAGHHAQDRIQNVKRELRFLKIFMEGYENWPHVFNDEEEESEAGAVDAVDRLMGVFDDLYEMEIRMESDEEMGDDEAGIEGLCQVADMIVEKFQHLKKTLLDLSNDPQVDFKKRVDSAIKILNQLLILKPAHKKKIGAVAKRLELVSAIFLFASSRDLHDEQQFNSFFNHLQNWANSAASVPFLYWIGEQDERFTTISHLIEMFNSSTIKFVELYLQALKPSQGPEYSVTRLARAHFIQILVVDILHRHDDDGDSYEMLQHGLAFYISFLMNPPQEYAEEESLNLCVNKAASLICSLLKEGRKNTFFHDLMEKINQAKAETRDLIHCEITTSISVNNFPKTNVQGFLDFFMEDLEEKLKCQTASMTTYQRNQIIIVQEELLCLKPLLKEIFELRDENEELQDLRKRASRMVYCTNYVIDSCILLDPVNYWRNEMFLSHVTEEIQSIETWVTIPRHARMWNKKAVLGDKMNSGGILHHQTNNTNAVDDVVMVGFAEEKEEIINRLIGGLPQRDIVAIMGMGGQGKTTLAKKVYHDHRIRLHFKTYAWCCISQAYQIQATLVNIVKQVNPALDGDAISRRSHEDLAEILYKCLKGRTYLIVLDDIWDIGAWNMLKASLPDDGNGSRIMFTSRIHNATLEAKSDCSILTLLSLSPEDSLELLQQKLSYKDGLPLNLLDIGKRIVEICQGLPLAIVVAAGLLGKIDANPASWKLITESLKSKVARGGCTDVLEASYEHLPDYLKPCFLYFATFEEDEKISTKKLIQYWIAEGFVQNHGTKSLEDVANEYLIDLVERSLLFVVEMSSKFRIKTCHVHDLVRELCLEKVKDDNFFLLPNISDNYSVGTIHQSYRLFFPAKCWPSFELELPTIPIVRTLLFSKEIKFSKGPFFFTKFKLLRVLDLSVIEIDLVIDGIMQLVHLRYLALQGNFHVPSSIVNLSRLEFLSLRSYKIVLTNVIWNMRSLRHLCLVIGEFSDTDDVVDKSHQLDNLEIFSFSCLGTSYGKHLERLFKRMPNLRKLHLEVDFPVQLLSCLTKLESLNCFVIEDLSAIEFNLPSTLRHLTMRGPISLSASFMSAIGRLHNLETLKLFSSRLEDCRWNVEDEEFSNLKYLNLSDSNIKEWNVTTVSFPKLEQLFLSECLLLSEIPSEFEVLPTLKAMRVYWCHRDIANSVREIATEQRDLGNVGLQITYKEEE